MKACHKFSSQDVAGLHIISFHEAVPCGRKNAITTEEAQYSTSSPCALALVHGTVMPQHVADEALEDPEVQRLSAVLSMDDDNYANRLFPRQRMARTEITLHAGDILKSGWFEPKWDAAAPPHTGRIGKKLPRLCAAYLGSDAQRCPAPGRHVVGKNRGAAPV